MADLLGDWNELDNDHKKFVLRVRNGCGGKYSAEPHCTDSEEIRGEINLWDKAEKSGFIECIGTYKWLVTEKFLALEGLLFGID